MITYKMFEQAIGKSYADIDNRINPYYSTNNNHSHTLSKTDVKRAYREYVRAAMRGPVNSFTLSAAPSGNVYFTIAFADFPANTPYNVNCFTSEKGAVIVWQQAENIDYKVYLPPLK